MFGSHVRPNKWNENDCQYCHKACAPYDRQIDHPRSWRGLDWGGTLIDVVRYPRKRGRPRTDDADSDKINAEKAKAEGIKDSAYALGKAPEHLTKQQQIMIEMIAQTDEHLYRAYRMKGSRRLLLKITNPEEAEAELKHWLLWASYSRIPAFKELYQRIKKHKEHILNTIRLRMSNTHIEAINNKIKLIVRKTYGFRNLDNMLDMVYLVCSDLRVPLSNRKSNALKPA